MSKPQAEDVKTEQESQRKAPPPAGPHAKPELTDSEKTPGAGSLPDPKDGEVDVGSE